MMKFNYEKHFRKYFIESCKVIKNIIFVIREESNSGQPDITLILKNGKKIGVELKIHRVNKIYDNQKEVLKLKTNYLLTQKKNFFILKNYRNEEITSDNIFVIIKKIIT